MFGKRCAREFFFFFTLLYKRKSRKNFIKYNFSSFILNISYFIRVKNMFKICNKVIILTSCFENWITFSKQTRTVITCCNIYLRNLGARKKEFYIFGKPDLICKYFQKLLQRNILQGCQSWLFIHKKAELFSNQDSFYLANLQS